MRHFDTWKNRSKSGAEARNIVNKLLARASSMTAPPRWLGV